MGTSLVGLRTPSGSLSPGGFRCNEKLAYRMLSDPQVQYDAEVFSKLLKYLGLNGAPLQKLADADDILTLEEYSGLFKDTDPKIIKSGFENYRRRQDAAWQDPKDLRDFLKLFKDRLSSSPPPKALDLDLDEEDLPHFLEHIYLFLDDLSAMAVWAVENGIARVRIEWAA